ncbi:MAG: aquaporin [archaeon]|nr:MAG: aquaporin [archaeon]
MSSRAPLSRRITAEFLGTFVFVLVGAGSAVGAQALGGQALSSGILIAAFANGLGLAMAVSATMGVSGGVLNPAVAVGLVVGRKLELNALVPYVVAELAGATAAGLLLVLSFPSSLGSAAHWGAPTLSGQVAVVQGVAIEALLTFVLVFAVYGTAVDERAPKIGGLGIGLAVLADVLVGGALTGAAMNPARAFGPMIAGSFLPYYWFVYLVGPVLGSVAAALAYRFGIERTP